MATRRGGDDRGVRRPRTERGRKRPIACRRRDRTPLLAVCLTAVVLLSLIALPVAGAPPVDAAYSGGNGGGGNSNAASSSNAGGNSNAGGSGENAASSSNAGGNSNVGGGGEDAASRSNGPADSNTDRTSDTSRRPSGRSDANAGDPVDADAPPQASGRGLDTDGDRSDEGTAADESRGPGPSVDVTTDRPADRGQARTPGRSGAPTPSVVDVAVDGARAGDDVSVDVSPPSVEADSVAFDGIALTVERDGDFTMRVTNSRDPLPGSPAFEPDDAAESLGRIRLDHSITNEEVEDVTYSFRVSKARLHATDTDPENVALYRYSDGSWTSLSTDVVGETASHYLYSADSPGMSEFAVGAKRPAFDAYWADVDASTVEAGEGTTVRGRVTNVGSATGVYVATLVVDGAVVDEREVTIAPGGTRQVNFETEWDQEGTYEVSVDGTSAGVVTVRGRPDATSSTPSDGILSTTYDVVLGLGRTLVSTPLVPAVP